MTPYRKLGGGAEPREQYSFVSSPDDLYYYDLYYYITTYRGEWVLYKSGGPWKDTWTGCHSVEVSWLEVLIRTGRTEESIEEEIRTRSW